MAVQFEKHILRDILGDGGVAKESKGDAEHHSLLTAHDSLEIARNERFPEPPRR